MSAALNYTTKIPVAQSLTEAQSRLAAAGADHIGVGYTDGQPTALTFRLKGPHGIRDFEIPVNVDAVHRLLNRQVDEGRVKVGGMSGEKFRSRDHAAQVAWRIMKDWVAVQTTLVEAQMIGLDEIMLPHLIVDGGRTLAETYRDREAALLELAGPE